MDLPAPAPPSQPLTSFQTSVAASQHGPTLWDSRKRLSTALVILFGSFTHYALKTKVHVHITLFQDKRRTKSTTEEPVWLLR